MQRPGGGSGEEWERLFRQGRERFSDWSSRFGGGGGSSIGGRRASFFFFGALVIALLVWLATGFYTVDPDEQALVRQFGRVTGISGQGLHWRPPTPIARHDTVKVTQVRRMEVGFRTLANNEVRTHPVEALMITGDENIVDVEMVVSTASPASATSFSRCATPATPTAPSVTVPMAAPSRTWRRWRCAALSAAAPLTTSSRRNAPSSSRKSRTG